MKAQCWVDGSTDAPGAALAELRTENNSSDSNGRKLRASDLDVVGTGIIYARFARGVETQRIAPRRSMKFGLASRRKTSPGAPTQAVPEQIEKKKTVESEIARPQPARFGAEAIEPRQSVTLHPRWSIGFHSRVDIECKPHSQNYAAPDQVFVPPRPRLLLGRPETNPDKIR